MGFLSIGKGLWFGFLSGFPSLSFTICSTNWTLEIATGCMSLKKEKSQGKAVKVTVKRNEGKDFCLDFVQEFVLGRRIIYFLVSARMF